MAKIEYIVVPKHELEEILETLEDCYTQLDWFLETIDPVMTHVMESIEILVERLKVKRTVSEITSS